MWRSSRARLTIGKHKSWPITGKNFGQSKVETETDTWFRVRGQVPNNRPSSLRLGLGALQMTLL